jgi:hypothetical protein
MISMPLQSSRKLVDLTDKFLARLLSRVRQRESRRQVLICTPKLSKPDNTL